MPLEARIPLPAITAVTAETFHTPLHSPFVTSQGSATAARAVAITITLEDGGIARGESVPLTYVTGETIPSVLETVQRFESILVGQSVARYRPLFDLIARHAPEEPSARCGLEMAILDAWSRETGSSLWEFCGGALVEAETDITIPIVPNAEELTELAWALGMRVFKIKVGDPDIEADYARVSAVRRAAPEARLRLDANQAFTPDAAVAFVDRLLSDGARIELLEQPVKKDDFGGLIEVAQRCAVPVFADETLRTPQHALRLASTPVQGYNLKINKCGISGVLDIIAIARAANKRLMLGCMLETRRSIAVSLAIACGTGAFEFLDLDSHLLLNEPGENPFFHQEGALLRLPTRID